MNLRKELEQLHTASFGWAMACCSYRRQEAEDVLQAAYLKILDGHARYGGTATFRTWVFSVIGRTAADSRRREWLHRGLLARWHLQEAAADARTSLETIAENEDIGQIGAALEQLSRRQREVLHLVFYQDFTIEEAAGVLRLSTGSARTHFERGKSRLRALLARRAPL